MVLLKFRAIQETNVSRTFSLFAAACGAAVSPALCEL